MEYLTLLSILSSLAGWLYALNERGRRISAERKAADARARLVLATKHFVLSRKQLQTFAKSGEAEA